MPFLETFLGDMPHFMILDLAEPEGVSSPVVGVRVPEHLCGLASGPGGHIRAAKEALVVVVQSGLASHISSASTAFFAASTTPTKHQILKTHCHICFGT